MGGYATHVNRFLFLTLSLMLSVTSPLLSFHYASGPTLDSALSHLPIRLAPLCPLSGWSPEMANTSSVSAPSCRTLPLLNDPCSDRAPSESECHPVRSLLGSASESSLGACSHFLFLYRGSIFDLLACLLPSSFAGIVPRLVDTIIHLLGLT